MYITTIMSLIGRQGTRSVATLVVIGIALPWIGAFIKPFVTEAVFVLLVIAFLQMDMAAVKRYLRRPVIVLSATVWTAAVIPLILALICLQLGVNTRAPELFLGLMLQAVASPLMAGPALARLMGLDDTLVLVILVTSTAAIPLTAPLFALLFVGPSLSIPPMMLAIKLFVILAGAALISFGIRKFVSLKTIEKHSESINGLNILVLFVFVAAIMENVGENILNNTLHTALLTVLAFAAFFAVLFLTFLVFLPAGRGKALSIGFMVSQRNMGLMIAATEGALPGITWLYFALSQFPIYLSPHMLKSVAGKKHKTKKTE